MNAHGNEVDAPVPHLFKRARGAIGLCTCGRAYTDPCHDPFRAYEPRATSPASTKVDPS